MATGDKPEEADTSTINGVEVTREEAGKALGEAIAALKVAGYNQETGAFH